MRKPASMLLALMPMLAVAHADEPGKRIFDLNCAACHAEGVGHPGTQMLGWIRGTPKALLEKRTDLTADYVSYVVRHGLSEMPPFRPTTIDDHELADLASYLAHAGKAAAAKTK